jgi:hypothetical protein
MTPSPSAPTTRLEGLERAFRHYLAATNLYPGLDIRQCYWTSEGLTLQAHHPAPAVAKPNTLLRELEAAFLEILAEEGWAYEDLLPEGRRNPEAEADTEIPVCIELWLQPGNAPTSATVLSAPWRQAHPDCRQESCCRSLSLPQCLRQGRLQRLLITGLWRMEQ